MHGSRSSMSVVAPVLFQRGATCGNKRLSPRPRRRATIAAASSFTDTSLAVEAELRQPPAEGLVVLAPDASAHDAICAAAAVLGRQPGQAEAALAQKLADNWYGSAGDISSMSQDEIKVVGMPVRLWAAVKQLLEQPPPLQQELPPASSSGDSMLLEIGAQEALQAGMASLGATVQSEASTQQEVPIAGVGGPAEALHPDIMQRRMPAAHRGRKYPKQRANVTRRKRLPSYGLLASDMTPALEQEFAALRRFSCGRWLGQVVPPVATTTFDGTQRYLKLLLGWLHRYRCVPLEQLSLASAFPSHEPHGVCLVFDWCQWMAAERGANARTEFNALSACVHAVRFLYHEQCYPSSGGAPSYMAANGSTSAASSSSNARPAGAVATAAMVLTFSADPSSNGSGGGSGRQPPYGHLPVMRALKQLVNAAGKKAKKAPLVSDESAKWLDWEEYLQLVAHLRRECAGLTASGQPRSRKAVAASLQRYLIFAILSCVPDRQRTLRELEVGRTLQQDGDRWLIRHGPGDYKTGKVYGERPPLVLAPFLYPELEAFICTWRAELQPKVGTLFVNQASGTSLTDNSLYDLFTYTAQRIVGRPCNPHLVRDMIVTYLRARDTSVAELEALAIYMGHSIDMQRDTYDRRTRAQKVTPAVQLLGSLADKALGSTSS